MKLSYPIMKKALDEINESFRKQLNECQQELMNLENQLMARKELALKLQGALEGFALVDQEAKKPENQPMVQLDDEDENTGVTVENILEE